jgi:diguanylate cyclase (GGDEF)-like protein
LVGQAIRTRKPMFSNDISVETGVGGRRREEAVRLGYRSLIVLPLFTGDAVVGILAMFAKEPDFFDDEEIKLLTELAGDVSFALDHIAKEEKLDYLAYYDAITGLPNRTLFNDRLDQRVAAAHRDQKGFSVMMLDLERFRHINETLGRQVGDDLLRQLAARLKRLLEETDIVAHAGSDHFVIATRRAEEGEGVVHLLEQILTGISGEPFQLGGNELRIAPRAGIALYPADGTGSDALLKNAEAALKNAKVTGQRFQFYAPQMNARVAEQLKLENDLRNALLHEQYVLHYQPRIDFSNGRITGLEALIRWKHPERGMVSPGEFIPMLEETGMIVDVGRWALQRAALEHAGWSASGLKPPRVAVNVSPAQLRRGDFVDYVRDALAAVEGACERIDIEITESMLMEDIDGSIAKLKAVQGMGLQVALDDFGTGYSSLSYLARLPINSLKVDRSFVTQMPKSPEQMAIVSTVISLARALNLKVVAEGVETEEQANLLRLLRCDEVQGYLFGRPMPSEQIEVLLTKAR